MTFSLDQKRRNAQARSGAEATRRAFARRKDPDVFDWDAAIARLKIMLNDLDERDARLRFEKLGTTNFQVTIGKEK